LQLRKPHACGANEWEVVRLGADIGLRCRGCAHRILLPRPDLERRLTSFLHRSPRSEPPGDLDLPRSD
jgi:hypothetical protein